MKFWSALSVVNTLLHFKYQTNRREKVKVKVEINLDWLDENYNIDEQMKERVILSITDTFKIAVNESINRKINKKVSVKVDKWIMDQLHNFCDRKIEITDKWGDTQEYHESVTEMFKSKFDDFFNATVNEKGETQTSCGYGSKRLTRIDLMLNQKAEEYLKKVTDNMDREIKRAITDAEKLAIKEKITKHVTEQLARITI